MSGPGTEAVEGIRRAAAFDAVGDVLAECRPMLEAVAGAAAEQPPAGALGMGGDEEVRVGCEVVLADPCAGDARTGERGKAPREIVPRELLIRGQRETLDRVGIDLLAAGVGRDLHPQTAELAVAIEGAVVVA